MLSHEFNQRAWSVHLALGIGSVAGSGGCQIAACASDFSDFVAVVIALKSKHLKPLPGVFAAVTAAGAFAVGAASLLVTRR